ncbi:MAG TPA: PIG-L deacetylase family protein [Acidimicrobiales bacterium]|nr:PIG-L deacetylase family protein [Acidimicrobiales bacterium]
MNVVVVAPHPDDETLGCGGAIRLHADSGDRVTVVFLTSGELGLSRLDRAEAQKVREAEAQEAAAVLGIDRIEFLHLLDWELDTQLEEAADSLCGPLERLRPDLVYAPHEGEWHPDHRVALGLTRTALRRAGLTPELRSYEFWTPLSPVGLVMDITAVMPAKVAAVRCYRSQLEQTDYERAVVGLNQYRGILDQHHVEYAEAFRWEALEPGTEPGR